MTAETSGAAVRTVLDTGAGLVRRLVTVPAGSRFDGAAGPGGELWFVIAGAGEFASGGAPPRPVRPDTAVWLPPGGRYRLSAGVALRVDSVCLPAGPAGAAADDAPRLAELGDRPVEMTGDRRFRVLFGPGNGCPAATQFVGEIPPGRAPDHSHPYDEVVLILSGDGVAHIGGSQHALAPGTCLHLPPGLQHCLENTGPALLRVLGVFHPADSPAAKLLPPPATG